MRILIACFLSLITISANGHQSSTALLSIEKTTNGVNAYLHWRLYDLEQAIGIDRDRNGELYWQEIAALTPEITALVFSQLSVTQAGNRCLPTLSGPLAFNDALLADAAVVVPVNFACEDGLTMGADVFDVSYQGMFDVLPEHRLLWSMSDNGSVSQGVLARAGTFSISGQPMVWNTMSEFFVQGIVHIGLGPDHVAFLLTLLLVSVLIQKPRGWAPAPNLRDCIRSAAILVTTFTVAHSLTLSASVLGWLALPSYWVELSIAVSVVVAALNNIRPFLPSSILMVFLFGLMHGFGFASVLRELTGDGAGIGWSLIGFNLGVEFGQIIITMAIMPILILLRRYPWYAAVFVRTVSAFIAGLGTYWILTRI
jgi:hypothetical protein